jgi:DNA-binding NtrC family response regulator
MPYRDSKTIAARGQIQLRYIHRAAKAASVLQCLIVSADPARRAMFERAATDGGWKTSLCVNATEALAHIDRFGAQLAIVDLEGHDMREFHPVVERLAATNGMLLIVCGNEGRIEEEIWARQSGAWLYLPGVVESTNFALLCGEARHIAERVSKTLPERTSVASTAQRKRHT